MLKLKTPSIPANIEVNLHDRDICDLPTIKLLRLLEDVHEMVPIGSKGIAYELDALLKRNNLQFHSNEVTLNLEKTAGLATCLILTANPKVIDKLPDLAQPITVLGTTH